MTYGLIGEKLGHSYSKQIHESLGRYTYDLLSLSREELEIYLKKREFSGLNITIPYKKSGFSVLRSGFGTRIGDWLNQHTLFS